MTDKLTRRAIAVVPSPGRADPEHSRQATGSPLDLAARLQRMGDDLAVLQRDLLIFRDRPPEQSQAPAHQPTLLTVEAAAHYLMVSRTLVFALIKNGALDSVQIGSARRIPRSACDAYVAGLIDAPRSA